MTMAHDLIIDQFSPMVGRRQTSRHVVRARTLRRSRRPSADVRQHERALVGNTQVQTGARRETTSSRLPCENASNA